MANSKGIGNNYEREFAKKLSIWATGDQSADVFWRDTSSGSRTTSRKKLGKQTAYSGDIIATELEYKIFTDTFYIDTKCYKKIDYNIFRKDVTKSNLFALWKKTVDDANGRLCIMPVYVRDRVTEEFLVLSTRIQCNIPEKHMIINIFPENVFSFETSSNEVYNMLIVPSNKFFEINNYATLLANNAKEKDNNYFINILEDSNESIFKNITEEERKQAIIDLHENIKKDFKL